MEITKIMLGELASNCYVQPVGNGNMIHIGKVIEKVLRDQGKTVTWFARSLYCDRTNVYKIFQRESVDSEMLYRISKILSHDFFKYYSKELEEDTEEI